MQIQINDTSILTRTFKFWRKGENPKSSCDLLIATAILFVEAFVLAASFHLLVLVAMGGEPLIKATISHFPTWKSLSYTFIYAVMVFSFIVGCAASVLTAIIFGVSKLINLLSTFIIFHKFPIFRINIPKLNFISTLLKALIGKICIPVLVKESGNKS